MKKLMLALAVVATAAVVNAASFSWKTSATGKVFQPGSTTVNVTGVTAYLFDAATTAQSDLVKAFNDNGTLTTTDSISSAAISSGAIAATTFEDTTAVGATLTAYFAVIANVGDKDYLYISPTTSGSGVEGKTTAMTSINAKASSQAAAMDASAGYTSAGWYEAAAVPEPTSGLLLLVGGALLALRRRRA